VDLKKPECGAPCNGCGLCCQLEACHLSVQFLNSTTAPCVALEHEDGRYWCGLVRNPAKYLRLPAWASETALAELSPKFAAMLWLGSGCDSEIGTGTEQREASSAK
jgi:hypothetical protein